MSDLNRPDRPDGVQGDDEPAESDAVPTPEFDEDDDASGLGPVPPPPD